jgi:hypothetical protein
MYDVFKANNESIPGTYYFRMLDNPAFMKVYPKSMALLPTQIKATNFHGEVRQNTLFGKSHCESTLKPKNTSSE